jgi:predicted MFS family arabinose efflux permease
MITKTIDLYKNAYNGLTKRMWLLSIVMLINRSGTMVLGFMTLYCTHIGYTLKQGGFVVALYGIGSLVGALAGGKISDTFGFYYTQFSALFFGGVMFIVLGQMRNYEAICITTFFLAMINESFRPANATAIAHYSTAETRTQSFSLVRLSINLGWAVGSALAGFLAAKNYHLLFWVDGFTNISAAIMLLVILPKVTKAQQQKPTVKAEVIARERSPYTDKKFLIFIAFQIIFAACFFQIFTTIPVFFKKGLHLSEFYIGSSMAASGLMIALFEMILVFKLEGKRSYLLYMAIGSILMGLAYLILIIPIACGLLIAIAAIFVITLGEMMSMPFMNSFYIARSSERTRGQYAGMYTMAWSAAQVIGSMSGAAFADEYGFNNLWIAVAGFSFMAALGYYYLQKVKD